MIEANAKIDPESEELLIGCEVASFLPLHKVSKGISIRLSRLLADRRKSCCRYVFKFVSVISNQQSQRI